MPENRNLSYDIDICGLKISSGSNNPGEAAITELKIVEDMTKSSGSTCFITVVDPTDAVNKYKIKNEKKPIKINITTDGGNRSFEFYPLQNQNLKDPKEEGALHTKTWSVTGNSKEFFKSNDNGYVEKSWKDKPTHEIVKYVYEEHLGAQFQVLTPSDEPLGKYIASNKHPFGVTNDALNKSVSKKYKSSFYVIYKCEQNGQEKFYFTTLEERFSQGPVAQLVQTSTSDSSASSVAPENRIVSCIVPQNFNSSYNAYNNNTSQQTWNLTHHMPVEVPPEKTKFKLPGQDIPEDGGGGGFNPIPRQSVYDQKNHSQKQTFAEARTNREKFLAHLQQNYGLVTIPYNSKIYCGAMVDLKLPNRTDATLGQQDEQQFGGKVLVSQLTHRILKGDSGLQYLMDLRCIKASHNA